MITSTNFSSSDLSLSLALTLLTNCSLEINGPLFGFHVSIFCLFSYLSDHIISTTVSYPLFSQVNEDIPQGSAMEQLFSRVSALASSWLQLPSLYGWHRNLFGPNLSMVSVSSIGPCTHFHQHFQTSLWISFSNSDPGLFTYTHLLKILIFSNGISTNKPSAIPCSLPSFIQSAGKAYIHIILRQMQRILYWSFVVWSLFWCTFLLSD